MKTHKFARKPFCVDAVRVNGVQVGMWGDDVEALAVAAMEVAA